jgi:hypothetical protein
MGCRFASTSCDVSDIHYNGDVRRKSAINEEKRLRLVEQARRMKPAERLAVCVRLSEAVAGIHLAGKRERAITDSDRKS